MKHQRKWWYIAVGLLLLLLFIFQKWNTPQPAEPLYRNPTHLIYTKHAKCRMRCRQIDAGEITDILKNGTLNRQKSGKGKKGDITYALEGWSKDDQHIRIVVTPEEDGLLVITVIDLEKEWPCHCDEESPCI